MEEVESGFVRFTHRRCEDCEIREDLHASGAPLPKRRHRIAGCLSCSGRGELPLGSTDGLDPYRKPAAPGREQLYEAKRKLRAHEERHRFRTQTYLYEMCELLMQIPPGGANHGRTRTDGTWRPLEGEGKDGDVYPRPSFKRQIEPLVHGTRSAYNHRGCRCFLCRQANARYKLEQSNGDTAISRGYISGPPALVGLEPAA